MVAVRLLRSEVPDGSPLSRPLRELVEALERILFDGPATLPLLGARWVEVVQGADPAPGDGRVVFSRTAGRGQVLTRLLQLESGVINLIPHPLARKPAGRLVTFQERPIALKDYDPAALDPAQDPTKWIAVEPSADGAVSLMVFLCCQLASSISL